MGTYILELYDITGKLHTMKLEGENTSLKEWYKKYQDDIISKTLIDVDGVRIQTKYVVRFNIKK
ncbi:hypothetical protein OXR01_13210 [Staphylococcus gallinarum]|uniref:hypothetical protein n=1 Tax=Staphylococcus gallinarum TaxID=1293 RepID=UPI00227F1D90|nr:hypothetical protein [Staphylococcus gallinarum]MDN6414847.1 hypothetical protein [Staphylococcus gallinarum]